MHVTVPNTIASRGELSTSEVAEELQCHRSTVWLYIRSGALKATRHGKFYGVKRKDLDRFRKLYVSANGGRG